MDGLNGLDDYIFNETMKYISEKEAKVHAGEFYNFKNMKKAQKY